MSGGWSPTLHLTSHKGHRPRWDEDRAIFVPDKLPAGMRVAGAANGDLTLGEAILTGYREGLAAAIACGHSGSMPTLPRIPEESTRRVPLWRVARAQGKCFVDFQNDVTADDIELAEREGFRSVEHAKRYTTLGMATDQGKTSNVTGIALLAQHRARSIAETGTTTFRPPYTPIAMGAMAGHHRGMDFRPTRYAPSHRWASELGASFIESGPWLRAQWFPRPGETDWFEPTCRETKAVRSAVGLCDVSTLGKIDVQGPDALRFIERLYANNFATLAVGRTRYGIMLREDGFMFDDGTAARLAENRYLITTTTSHAVQVYQHMHLCHQTLWPELDVQFVSVTDQWAQFAVAGPRSRELLQRVLDPSCDLSNAAFPFMACGDVVLRNGEPARLFRISFSGELAYEIAVPGHRGDALIRTLHDAGQDLGVVPYGLEALNVLRVEKGHVVGSELNGQTTAHDLGFGRMLSTQKDFIGAVLGRRAQSGGSGAAATRRHQDRGSEGDAGRWHALHSAACAPQHRARPGLRHVRLLFTDPGSVDRPRPADQRTRASWREGHGRRSPARRRDARRGLLARVHRSGRSAPPWLTHCISTTAQGVSVAATARQA